MKMCSHLHSPHLHNVIDSTVTKSLLKSAESMKQVAFDLCSRTSFATAVFFSVDLGFFCFIWGCGVLLKISFF